jgi:hypothetical protein
VKLINFDENLAKQSKDLANMTFLDHKGGRNNLTLMPKKIGLKTLSLSLIDI